MDVFDGDVPLFLVDPDQFQQVDLGNGEALPAAGDDQRRHDGQGQGDADLESGAVAEFAFQVDDAADFFDVGLDHVHADAAPGDVGDLFGGGETRQEDQPPDVLVAHGGGAFRGDQALFERLVAQFDRIDAGAVVADFDVHLAAFVVGAHRQAAFLGLAGGAADRRKFDAVVDGVADQMGQRVFHRLDQAFVEFGFLAFHVHPHLLAATDRQVTHHAGEFGPDVVDGLHPGAHDAFLEFAGDQVQPLRRGQQRRIFLKRAVFEDLVARQHQFSDQVHQFVQQRHVHPDGAFRDGGRCGGAFRRRGDRLGRGGGADGRRDRFRGGVGRRRADDCARRRGRRFGKENQIVRQGLRGGNGFGVLVRCDCLFHGKRSRG